MVPVPMQKFMVAKVEINFSETEHASFLPYVTKLMDPPPPEAIRIHKTALQY